MLGIIRMIFLGRTDLGEKASAVQHVVVAIPTTSFLWPTGVRSSGEEWWYLQLHHHLHRSAPLHKISHSGHPPVTPSVDFASVA